MATTTKPNKVAKATKEPTPSTIDVNSIIPFLEEQGDQTDNLGETCTAVLQSVTKIPAMASDNPFVLSSIAKGWTQKESPIIEVIVKQDVLGTLTFSFINKKSLIRFREHIKVGNLVLELGKEVTLYKKAKKNDPTKNFFDLLPPEPLDNESE